MAGPLHGTRVVEIAGIGPGPFCAMLLADLGAEVLRVDRPGGGGLHLGDRRRDVLNRGRRSVAVDLKAPGGAEVVLRLVERGDALIEGFRPGVAERLGIGPDSCLRRNPRLVYGRMTGWGQDGTLAAASGHDINYIALAGALHPIGRGGGTPVPPLNLVGDFGGGAMFLAVGVLAALVERTASGQGQVVDAAMVDGSALLTAMFHGMRAMGTWSERRGENLLDTGAPFYEVYPTADGEFVAVGALEPQFFAELMRRVGLDGEFGPGDQYDRSRWPAMRERLTQVFASRTRDEWDGLLEASDACYAPVLSLAEAPAHPHNRQRGVFVEVDGVVQPAPAPRFDRTPTGAPGVPALPGEHTDEALADWGFEVAEVAELRAAGVLG